MKKSLYSYFALAAAAFFAGFSAVAAEKGNLVADPASAVKNTWKKYPVSGKDFWMLLDPRWLNLKGVSHEEFVQKSGTGFVHQTVSGENVTNLRVLTIGEITSYDARNRRRKATIEVIPEEKDMLVTDPQYLNDGSIRNYCVFSGNVLDMTRRYAIHKNTLKFKSDFAIARLAINHGVGKDNRISKLLCNGKEVQIPADKNTFDVKITPAAKEFELTVYSSPLKYQAKELNVPYEERLKKAPFWLTNMFRANYGNIFGTDVCNFDQESFASVRKKYGENFIGYWLPEWDHNYILAVSRPNLPYYKTIQNFIKVPCNKEDFVKGVLKFCWDSHKPLFGKDLLGMSGQVLFMHHACDWGSTVSGLEITQEKTELAGRISFMFTRGASRQFDKPMYIYQAYYGGSQSPNSTLRGYTRRIDWGVAPSLTLRNFMASYYMGNNYLDFEAQPYGMVLEEKGGNHSLTGNGKVMKEFYEWTASDKGKRGESYAPILLLADRKHGYDMWYRIAPRGWDNFYNIYPLTDANFFMEYVMQVISPRYDYNKFDNPKYSPNLHNSTVGDIFDLYLANPLVNGEVRLDQLKKYPVVALVDDITYTEKLANTLKQYVAEGGTLLLTTGQTAPFEEDKDFLGVTIGKDTKKEDGLFVNSLTLLPGTETVMATSRKTPLATKKKYGNGHVILLASPYMKKTGDLTKVPQQLVKLFEKIQSELLPVKVEGDCQYLFNIMPDGTWKVILINNRGIVKLPKESTEKHFKEFTSKVTLTVPAGVTIKELRKNAVPAVQKGKDFDKYTFTIAPADIYVVDMKGIKFGKTVKKGAAKFNKVKNYKFAPYTPVKANDGYKPRPAATLAAMGKNMVAAPAIVGSWKGEGMKEVTGNGYELKFHNVEVKDGVARYNTKRSWATLNAQLKHSLPAVSYELVVKPAPIEQWKNVYGRHVRGGVLYPHRNLMLEYYHGRWTLLLFERIIYDRVMGPKAAPEWTHLCVTTEKNIARLFVNGKEVKRAAGPIKSINEFGSKAPTSKIGLTLGSLAHTWPIPYSFQGEIKEFTIHGKTLSPEEIAKLAEKVKK
ncbi:MAG: LamG domain-containing protein [Lentisphaeria bacterium]|nr:LamG domain-containing protein [Lentisphaeria bacterium]